MGKIRGDQNSGMSNVRKSGIQQSTLAFVGLAFGPDESMTDESLGHRANHGRLFVVVDVLPHDMVDDPSVSCSYLQGKGETH